jgi:hypothetical protein
MSKKSAKSTTGPSKFAQPYISSAANTLQSTFQGNQQNVADLSAGLNSALPQIQANALNNPTLSAAGGYDQDVLSGKYLGAGNPYLAQQIANTNNSVGDAVNAKIGMIGGAGGSAQAAILARELAKNETNLRYTDYTNERQAMAGAASNATSVAGAQNGGLAAYLAAIEQAATLPTVNASGLASGIGGLLGNYTTTKQTPSLASQLVNAAAAAAQAYAGGGA